MASTDPNTDAEEPSSENREISDLIGVKLTLWLMAWFIAVLVAFFFIGVVVGIVVLLAGIVAAGMALVSALRRSETNN